MKLSRFLLVSGLSSALLLGNMSVLHADDDDYGYGYRRGQQQMQSSQTQFNCVDPTTLVMDFPQQTLTEAEKQALLYLRSEEKLARDVYNTLYQQWQLRIFSNIPQSEQRHFAAVKSLLDKYQLADPEATTQVGEYAQAEFNDLYTKLVTQGKQSLAAALQVGVMIEEKDIQDLQQSLQNTDNLDMRFVFQNLQKGSRNHLRAFMRVLQMQGGSYTPQYLSQADFDAILNSAKENRMMYDDAGELVTLCSGQGNGGWGQQSGSKVELRGNLINITGNRATLQTSNNTVVQVDLTQARFEHGNRQQLRNNVYVKIEGMMQGQYLQAWEVELED